MPELFLSPVFVRQYLITGTEDAMTDGGGGSDEFNVTVLEAVDYLPGPSGHQTSRSPDSVASDLWIGVALILMILSCIGCVCSCLLYHKFQQWKQHERRDAEDPECPRRCSSESLPSYTLVTGLPTYDQAMEAIRQYKAKQAEAAGDLSQLSPSSLVLFYPGPPPLPLQPGELKS